MATNQREQQLKFELLVPILAPDRPTALCSFNWHQGHFSGKFDLRLADGAMAQTATIQIKSLSADAAIAASEELLFSGELPDLVVADRGFAARAVRAGIEVVALGDLDAVALGLTAARGYPLTLVPLQDHRPPAAYAVLAALATEVAGRRPAG